MSLSVGIVGLPNVGKSTLFNALLKRQQALAANYPFATIEPNVGIVEVPDERLAALARVVAESERDPIVPMSTSRLQDDGLKLPPLKPATIEFYDIAGLVAGASKGEGLGNQFLAHIRETDLICHVLRSFEDPDVVITGKMDPLEDLQTVRMELIFKDMETVERVQSAKYKVSSEKQRILTVLGKAQSLLEKGFLLNAENWSDDELEVLKPLFLLTMKPEIFVVNVSEEQLQTSPGNLTRLAASPLLKGEGMRSDDVVVISAQIESELASLDEADQKAYLQDLGLKVSGIEQMAQLAYRKLGLISFLTAGVIEARAWTIKKGTTAPEAAGTIHTDFAKKFIKAQVIDWTDFVSFEGWKKAREVGKVRQEGRDYVMRDGDVVEFMIRK